MNIAIPTRGHPIQTVEVQCSPSTKTKNAAKKARDSRKITSNRPNNPQTFIIVSLSSSSSSTTVASTAPTALIIRAPKIRDSKIKIIIKIEITEDGRLRISRLIIMDFKIQELV